MLRRLQILSATNISYYTIAVYNVIDGLTHTTQHTMDTACTYIRTYIWDKYNVHLLHTPAHSPHWGSPIPVEQSQV